MATTKYSVFVGDEAQARETRSKRQVAVDLATELRNSERADVRVVTDRGTEVFAMKAPKKIRMSRPFTRVVTLPEGAIIPEGHRVAYDRSRKNLAITHSPEEGYAVVRFTDGTVLADELATTREAGAFCKNVPLPEKASA